MAAEFFAQPNPGEELCRELETLTPANPFYTRAYVLGMQKLGAEAFLFGLRERGLLNCGCSAFLWRGRLNSLLEIPSVPAAIDDDAFWPALLQFCRKTGVTRLAVNSFGSMRAAIPHMAGEMRRRRRWEFVLDLSVPDLWKGMNAKHRARARQAREAGVTVRRTTCEEACDIHLLMMADSVARRAGRGEDVPEARDCDEQRAFLGSGAGAFYQAVLGNRVLSSCFVLESATGVYTHSSGSTPDGMACGANHLLKYEIARIAQCDSRLVCTLGGCDSLNSGLAQFKRYFGAAVVDLQSAEFYLGSPVRRRLETAIRLFTRERARLLQMIRGRIQSWLVYSVPADALEPSPPPDGILFRNLSDEDLRALLTTPWGQKQLERLEHFGFNGAYGVFTGGRLAHVSWLITEEYDRRDRPRHISLRHDEAEITGCETLPDYRGRGFYPLAIRALIQIARERGIRKIFMKTSPDNVSSQRGMEKAGLRRAGRIVQFVPPLLPWVQGLLYRGHRWRP